MGKKDYVKSLGRRNRLRISFSDAIEELERQWPFYRRVYEEAMK